ncbi:hypothetical protein [uncultured Parvibaculum sp.]|uniref:hypothetical protein n=1 Tax=uncultured Parvibaculum sp. TaxID=291828 RepID=UPI0030DAE65F|tara:strand:- start:59650 stop:59874 length:225 start_codon:yes stop_codon:yes gene_type:complete
MIPVQNRHRRNPIHAAARGEVKVLHAETRRREEEQIFAREAAKTRRAKKWLLALRAELFFAPKAQSIFFLRVFA